MTQGNTRRQLKFKQLSQIMPEVRRLLAGHRTVGQWTLAQVCKHLSDSFDGSLDGLDMSRHRIKRFFLHRQMLARALGKGIPPGYTVNPHLNPPQDVMLEPQVEGLQRAIVRYTDHVGELHPHPLFGHMSRETWDKVHLMHSAHHLSFVLLAETERPPRVPLS